MEKDSTNTRPKTVSGRLIVVFDGNGGVRILPIGSTDAECRALLEAFQSAARIGDFSDISRQQMELPPRR
jgi:hypothetical protein